MQFYQNIPEPVKHVGDVGAITSLILSVTGLLTPLFSLLASIATFLWMVVRVYESETIQKALGYPLKGKSNETES